MIRADPITGRVALFVAIEAEFERFGFAPFRMKECADEIEDGGRADRQAIAFWQDTARAPVIIDDAQEFPGTESRGQCTPAAPMSCSATAMCSGILRRT